MRLTLCLACWISLNSLEPMRIHSYPVLLLTYILKPFHPGKLQSNLSQFDFLVAYHLCLAFCCTTSWPGPFAPDMDIAQRSNEELD